MEDTSVRVCDLMSYHKELEQEELFLTALLSKIDKQIHALQVEQLQLLSACKNQPDTNSENYKNTEVNELSETENVPPVENEAELDLRPIQKFDVSEFEEEEDDNDEEEHLPDNSADFDYL